MDTCFLFLFTCLQQDLVNVSGKGPTVNILGSVGHTITSLPLWTVREGTGRAVHQQNLICKDRQWINLAHRTECINPRSVSFLV